MQNISRHTGTQAGICGHRHDGYGGAPYTYTGTYAHVHVPSGVRRNGSKDIDHGTGEHRTEARSLAPAGSPRVFLPGLLVPVPAPASSRVVRCNGDVPRSTTRDYLICHNAYCCMWTKYVKDR